MKKLRILQVSFDANLQPYQSAAFRGALAIEKAHHFLLQGRLSCLIRSFNQSNNN